MGCCFDRATITVCHLGIQFPQSHIFNTGSVGTLNVMFPTNSKELHIKLHKVTKSILNGLQRMHKTIIDAGRTHKKLP